MLSDIVLTLILIYLIRRLIISHNCNHTIDLVKTYDTGKYNDSTEEDMVRRTVNTESYVPNRVESTNQVFTYFDLYTMKKLYRGKPFDIIDFNTDIYTIAAMIQQNRNDWRKIMNKPARWNYRSKNKDLNKECFELFKKYCSVADETKPETLRECIITYLLAIGDQDDDLVISTIALI